ncbi:hypothetical protein ACH5RR_007979 [Cinchona calisaya]|uniref:Jacalin-type lectin domain-containing protein n=1 Tax=Cinchona calisaya TaxID=153742 RepID=A0ABD3AAD6_9GENT
MEGDSNQIGEKKKSIAVGPWGGNGGTAWDDGSYNGVREIKLVYHLCIDSMRVVYDKNGKPFTAEKHGGAGGNITSEIKLQFPEEFLASVSGYISPVIYGGSPVIRSLTFKSNKRTFGPFGVEEGTPFSLPIEGGQIVGFKGRSGWHLDSLGFHLARAPATTVLQKVQQRFKRLTTSVSLAPKESEEAGYKATKATAKEGSYY